MINRKCKPQTSVRAPPSKKVVAAAPGRPRLKTVNNPYSRLRPNNNYLLTGNTLVGKCFFVSLEMFYCPKRSQGNRLKSVHKLLQVHIHYLSTSATNMHRGYKLLESWLEETKTTVNILAASLGGIKRDFWDFFRNREKISLLAHKIAMLIS